MNSMYLSRRVLAREAFMCHYMNGGGGGIKSKGSGGKESYLRADEPSIIGSTPQELKRMTPERRAVYTDQIVGDRKKNPYWGKKS